ncbi:MAG: lipoprotein signal peptidase [Cyclobacteriaceae bacterium]|nr:MAG: lipoprotein signal peptidase [Cyclobacteriaceae bacterium]
MDHIKYYIISLFIVLMDQVFKLGVHLNMHLGEEILVLGEWFRLHYVLNPGIAFGIEFDFAYGKLLLTIFRILAAVGIASYLYILSKSKAHRILLLSLAMILAGATGNVIDSTFYGVILDNAPLDSVSPWFHGQVIDMLYFPLFSGTFPDWFPLWGNQSFQFFRPVFNIADASIFVGVTFILVLQKRFTFTDPSPNGKVLA